MGKLSEKLTAVQVKALKPRDKAYTIADGGGLSAHVAPSGTISWRYRYRFNGKATTLVLGQYPETSLKEARAKHLDARRQVSEGINPTEVRKKERKNAREKDEEKALEKENTFSAVAYEWLDKQQERWSKPHSDAVLNTLIRDVFPSIGETPVDQVTPPMVLKILRDIESRGALEIVRKVLQRMNAVFRFAVQIGKATYNPAADMQGALKARKVKHQSALTIDELPNFLKALTAGEIHVTTKLALQFTILTAARSIEVRGATWNEISLEERMWRIPADRMKMDSPHNVPLPKQAIAILERVGKLFGREGFIFPGIRQDSKQLSENTMLYALYRLGYHGKATVHGFRATFSTIANESGFDGDVIEKALAHEQRNRVRAAYHRSEYIEQRKELMQWWADLLYSLEHGMKAIPFRNQT